jgi:hypothetical protein
MVDRAVGFRDGISHAAPDLHSVVERLLDSPREWGCCRWSPLELQAEQDTIQSIRFSPFFAERVSQYNQLGARGEYLWRWCIYGLRAILFPSVTEESREHITDTKMLAVMYGVLLDDVADQWGDQPFLNRLMRATLGEAGRDFQDLGVGRAAYAQFTCDVWDEFQLRVSGYPRFFEFKDLLDYDNRQIVNTMWYSQLVNADISLLNIEEHDVYSPHNMQMMSFATIDLMCSPEFDHREVGRLRGAMWHAQCMGRIGNLVSTWERELKDGDYSSGVFAILAEQHPQLIQDMLLDKTDAIHAVLTQDDVEKGFLEKWDRHRAAFEGRLLSIQSVDLRQVLQGLDQLLRMEIGSRGRK